jgi:DNA-directed RNA polymerase specialized sigma24 family protein
MEPPMASVSQLKISAIAPSGPVPEFDAFLEHNRRFFARSALEVGLPVDDAMQMAWLAWHEAREKWSPAHASGATFNSYALTNFHNVLLRANEQVIRTRRSEDEIPDGENDGDDVDDRNGMPDAEIDQRNTIPGDSQPLMEDAIRQHPVFQRKNFRPVIEAVLKGMSAAQIAEQTGLTTRRVLQIIDDAAERLARPHVFRDDRFSAVARSREDSADNVRYRSLRALVLPQERFRGPEIIDKAVSIIDHGLLCPILIDQHNRVLDGVKRVIACRMLGLSGCRTVLHLIPGPDSDEDAPFLRLRRALTNATPGTDLGRVLIPELAPLMLQGELPALNGARLSYLSPEHQRRLLERFGVDTLASMQYQKVAALARAAERDQRKRIARSPRRTRSRGDAKVREVAHLA